MSNQVQTTPRPWFVTVTLSNPYDASHDECDVILLAVTVGPLQARKRVLEDLRNPKHATASSLSDGAVDLRDTIALFGDYSKFTNQNGEEFDSIEDLVQNTRFVASNRTLFIVE